MLSGSKYRFSLQWSNDTKEKVIVGQLLNRLGNKKSEFVVNALMEYIRAHPEMAEKERPIHITVCPEQSEERLQELVKELAKAAVEELLAGKTITQNTASGAAEPAGPSQEDLNAMLENLDIFH